MNSAASDQGSVKQGLEHTIRNLFEPLGSSCEFGFVLQRRGNNHPALLRWTAIHIRHLCKLLEADFADVFELESVRPHTDSMVMDTRYTWAFHSALASDGEGNFLLGPERFQKLFKIEQARVRKAVNAFRSRLQVGNLVGVHAADGVTLDDANRLLCAIDKIAGNETNRLLCVSGPGDQGREVVTPNEVSARVYFAQVAALAPYDHTDDADYENWNAILSWFEDSSEVSAMNVR